MKVNEIFLSEEQTVVLEFKLKHAVAGAAIGAALMGNPMKSNIDRTPPAVQQVQQQKQVPVILPAPKPKATPEEQQTANMIASTYKIEPEDALEIVRLANKYAKTSFPRAKDLLAIVGIESSFDPEAVSGLQRDPAVGLTQVRPKVWGIDPESLKDPEVAMKTSSDILHHYYRKLGKDKQAAVAAYNVGLGNFRNGDNAEGYVSKFNNELQRYTGIKL